MRTLLKPRWIAGHVLALLAVVAFVNLGFWQLRRYEEKVTLRDAVAASQELSPIPIEEAPAHSYRQVFATGTYDGSLQTKVLRSQEGVSGYHVITPFVFRDGLAVLVDRGWISLDAELPAPYSGATTISGTLWPAEGGSSVPETLSPAIRRIDPEIQSAFADYEFIDDYLLLTGYEDQARGDPIVSSPPEMSLGPHMGYALQWFVFAAVVLIAYPILLTKTVRRSSATRP